MTKGIVYDIPLRPDFVAQMILPTDLTAAEAARLRDFLVTLCADAPRERIALILCSGQEMRIGTVSKGEPPAFALSDIWLDDDVGR